MAGLNGWSTGMMETAQPCMPLDGLTLPGTILRTASPNGTAWLPLGTCINYGVGALAVYHGDLIACGYFSMAGGQPARNVARWNGMTWAPLGSGIDSDVDALTVFRDELIAGGDFSSAGG